MADIWLQAAVRNNAEWCDSMCRAHGMPGTFSDSLWSNPRRSPPLYPDAVTLTPAASADAVLAAIELDSPEPSVKDGFARLDLRDAGFRILFDAQWILRAPTPASPTSEPGVPSPSPRDFPSTPGAPSPIPRSPTSERPGVAPAALEGRLPDLRAATGDPIAWSTITTAAGLRDWETGLLPGYEGVLFPAVLLADPAVTLLAGRIDGDIVCGSALNTSDQVVGVSNVFASGCDIEAAWEGTVTMASTLFPTRPMVGYEHSDDLEAPLQQGFTPIGPLRIWLK
ncbi:hypothetical protein [Sphaerisporangium dianthi]|uniref:Uncharacterized protein n=1 Tax=Sphaerisporangium dianthi TaxID=1436120 RepID=A0ABV9CED4_9ACTN